MQGRAEMEESMTGHRRWSGGKGRDVTGFLVELAEEAKAEDYSLLWWKEVGPYKEKKGKWKTETGIGQTQVAKG